MLPDAARRRGTTGKRSQQAPRSFVLIGEPPRSQGDLNFSLAGIPIRVTPWFWIAGVLLGWNGSAGNPQLLLSWVIAAFISILIHELGHAFAFRYFGLDSQVVLYQFGGLAIPAGYQSSSGHRWRKYERVIVSAAGPFAQFVAATLVIVATLASGHGVPLFGFVQDLLRLPTTPPIRSPHAFEFTANFLYISIYWALLNLLPIYPLDGGQISRELFRMLGRGEPIRSSLVLSLACATMVAAFGFLNNRLYLGILFGMLAYSSYNALQSYGGIGGGYGRRW